MWLRLIAVVELLPGVLETQLRRDANLSHYEYFVLTRLSEAEQRTLRMTTLARHTNATSARLSHVVRRLESRGLVDRVPSPDDGRVIDAVLTDDGWDAVVAAAPGHVDTVRRVVLDSLSADQVAQARSITDAVLSRLDPGGELTGLYDPKAT